MPTYEYECKTNGHRFEIRQSFSEDSLTECVECGEPVRKVFSAAGIVFKGSGYYVTDTRPSKKKEASPSTPAGASGGDGGSAAPSSDTSTSSNSGSTNGSAAKSTPSKPTSSASKD